MEKSKPPETRTGVLHVVATPIGNLEDITLRAVRVLRESDLILAEDTRVTRKLLNAHGIEKELVSLYAQNELGRSKQVLDWLTEGLSIALVSDAGTPAVSDPGHRIIRLVHEAGFRVSPVPGPSALTAALSISGFPAIPFRFEGFFPRSPGKQRRMARRIAEDEITVAFFESPHRVLKTLDVCRAILPSARVCLVREATKVHETVVLGTPDEVIAALTPDQVRGEIVILIHPVGGASPHATPPRPDYAF